MASSRGFPSFVKRCSAPAAFAALLAPSLVAGCEVAGSRVHEFRVALTLPALTTALRAPRIASPSSVSVRQDRDARPAPPAPGACPAEMVRVGSSCVDRFEATLVEIVGGTEVAHAACDQPKTGVRYEARSAKGVAPQAYISRELAMDACQNAGKRLCTIAEWYEACRGPRALRYPYGDEHAAGTCNTNKEHLLGQLFGRNPQRWTYGNFNDPRLNREPGFLSPTGEHAGCVGEYGTYDMVGNLHEWVSDRVDHSLETKLSLVDGVRKAISRNIGNGIFMGGFYSTNGQQGEGCGYLTLGHGVRYHDYSTGFRCCSDAGGS